MIYYITKQLNLNFNSDKIFVTDDISLVTNFLLKETIIGCDTETEGFDVYSKKLILLQFGNKENQYVINTNEFNPIIFKSYFEDETKTFIFHNAKFDLRFLYKLEIKVKNVFDTYLAEAILLSGKDFEVETIVNEEGDEIKKGQGPKSLYGVTLKYCKYTLDKSVRGMIHRGLTERVIIYSAEDVVYLNEIREKQLEAIKFWKLENVLDLENEAVKVFALMEFNGLLVDTIKWKKVANTTNQLLIEQKQKLNEIVFKEPKLKKYSFVQTDLFGNDKTFINWGSAKQKLNILKDLKFDAKDTNDRTLQKLKHLHPLVKELINYNKTKKLNESFGENFLKLINKNTGRIHPNYNQIVSTGRISSKEPNVLNIPNPEKSILGKEIRNSFIARDGYNIVGGDYSGMELRLLAEFSQDPLWLDAFRKGKDLHSELASLTFGIDIKDVKNPTIFKPELTYRSVQKTVNFGLAYGMSYFKLADTIEVSQKEAQIIINNYFKVVPKVKEFLDNIAYLAKTRGYIRTAQPFSRIRFFDDYENKEDFKRQGSIERAGMNTPMQGTNGDIIKLALIKTQEYIDKNKFPAYILLSIYDEVETECREDLAEEFSIILKNIMIEAAQTVIKSIPVEVDIKYDKKYWDK